MGERALLALLCRVGRGISYPELLAAPGGAEVVERGLVARRWSGSACTVRLSTLGRSEKRLLEAGR